MSLSSNDIIEIEIIFKKTGQSIWQSFKTNKTVLENLLALKYDISHSCGGMGTCGTCHIFVDPNYQAPKSPQELEIGEDRGFANNERLACQIYPTLGMKIYLMKNGFE